jgi:hypothetical protein
MQRKVATTPKKTDEDRARDRERQRRKDEQNAYNRELIKAAGLADDAPAVKAKSATQIINEAKLEIQRKVMDLHAAGIDVDDIAIGLDLTIAKVKKLLDQGLAQLARGHARTNPSENFARYAYFHTRIIQRLDDMIDQFMADPDSKQYNATVTALRAQSDMLDKIYAKGKALGAMNLARAAPEGGMSGEQLLASLVKEKGLLESVIAELSISVTQKTLTAAVRRAPKKKKEVVEIENVETGEPQGAPGLLTETAGAELQAALEAEKDKE